MQTAEILQQIAVQTSAAKSEYLGRLEWHSISESPVPFDVLEDRLKAAQIPEDDWPHHTRPVDAFKCAVRDAAEPGYVVAYGTKVVDGKETRDSSVMLIAERAADGRNENLPVLLKVQYDADHATVTVDGTTYANGNPEKDLEVLRLSNRIHELYTTYRESYLDSDLRTMVSNGLRNGFAFMLKRHGGVYFVPEAHGTYMERMASVINGLPGCEMVAIPVVDRAPERSTLVVKYEKETTARIQELMLLAKKKVDSGETLTPSAFERFLKEIEYLDQQRGKYEDILQTTMGTVEVEMHAIKAYLTKLADQVGGDEDEKEANGGN